MCTNSSSVAYHEIWSFIVGIQSKHDLQGIVVIWRDSEGRHLFTIGQGEIVDDLIIKAVPK